MRMSSSRRLSSQKRASSESDITVLETASSQTQEMRSQQEVNSERPSSLPAATLNLTDAIDENDVDGSFTTTIVSSTSGSSSEAIDPGEDTRRSAPSLHRQQQHAPNKQQLPSRNDLARVSSQLTHATSTTYLVGEQDLTEFNDDTEIDIDDRDRVMPLQKKLDKNGKDDGEIIFAFPPSSSNDSGTHQVVHKQNISSDEGVDDNRNEKTNTRQSTVRFSRVHAHGNPIVVGNDDDCYDESEEYLSDDDLAGGSSDSGNGSHSYFYNEGPDDQITNTTQIRRIRKSYTQHVKRPPHYYFFRRCHSACQWKKIRLLCGKSVNHPHVQLLIIVLILLNSLTMGIGTLDWVEDNSDINQAFEYIDQGFLIIFSIELLMQLIFHGHRLFYDSWLVFDFVIIVSSWSLDSFQIVRAFRIFRAFRLFSRLKLLRNLLLAIFHVLPRMSAISMLLGLVIYIYAVMCTELFGDLNEQGLTSQDYFGRLDLTVFTLFELMTLNWSVISRQVIDVYPWSWGVFVSFVFISAFMVYNLIVAGKCDSAEALSDMANKVQSTSSDPLFTVVCDAVRVVEEGGIGGFDGQDPKPRLDDEETRSNISTQNRSRHCSSDDFNDLWSVAPDDERLKELQNKVSQLIAKQTLVLHAINHATKGLQQLEQQNARSQFATCMNSRSEKMIQQSSMQIPPPKVLDEDDYDIDAYKNKESSIVPPTPTKADETIHVYTPSAPPPVPTGETSQWNHSKGSWMSTADNYEDQDMGKSLRAKLHSVRPTEQEKINSESSLKLRHHDQLIPIPVAFLPADQRPKQAARRKSL